MSAERFTRRRFLKSAAGLAIGILFIDNSLPKRDFETDPDHPFDGRVWKWLRPVMEIFADGKKSNFWQWNTRNLPPEYKGLRLEGNPNAFVRISTLDRIRMSLGGWETAYEIEPRMEDAGLKTGGIEWQIGYKGINGGSQIEVWSGVLQGPVRFLRGNGDFIVYGIHHVTNKEIPLRVIDIRSRKDRTDGAPLVQRGESAKAA